MVWFNGLVFCNYYLLYCPLICYLIFMLLFWFRLKIITFIIFILLFLRCLIYTIACFWNLHHGVYRNKNHLLIFTLHLIVFYVRFHHTVILIYCNLFLCSILIIYLKAFYLHYSLFVSFVGSSYLCQIWDL